jgi:hypothetical protein
LAFEQKEKKPVEKKALAAGITSTALWVLSIVLAFVIKPGQSLAFVPDALLLLGFFPLLIIWRRGWLTFLFGIFNAFIGFFLLILQYLPDDKFTGSMQMMRNHLLSMHSSWTWIILGLVALTWGASSLIVSSVRWVIKKRALKSQAKSPTKS